VCLDIVADEHGRSENFPVSPNNPDLCRTQRADILPLLVSGTQRCLGGARNSRSKITKLASMEAACPIYRLVRKATKACNGAIKDAAACKWMSRVQPADVECRRSPFQVFVRC